MLLISYCLVRFSPYNELDAFRRRPYSVRIEDRNGTLVQITPLAGGLRREYRAQADIQAELAAVFVFAEDRRFYRHGGLDPLAIVRALGQNLKLGRRVSGASTITMQLARLIAANGGKAGGGRGLDRKIVETWNALRLETRLSKDEILELYLNVIPFGFQTEGVASAARNFFAIDVSMLSPAQIFCLAVIPRRPAAYNPLTGADSCAAAAQELWRRFVKAKRGKNYPRLAAVSEADWRFALEQSRRFEYPFEAPHFVRYVTDQLEKESLADGPRQTEITLSLDLPLQHYLEGLVAGNVIRFYASRLTNGAALVLDNKTAEILAWVGSAGYHDVEAAGQIDGVLARNQMGSTMKPFLYALALERGFRPRDTLADVPMNFGAERLYIPQNFNNRFNGPMLFRAALASSLNIPAVYLLYRLGTQNYTDYLRSLGFDSLGAEAEPVDGESGPGLGLALGNAPVSLAELARAFSAFPRDGVLLPLSWERLSNSSPTAASGVQVMSADTARIICSFLSDRSARVLAFGQALNFNAPFPVIFKTGTANRYQNIAALAASARYTVAVWMGNFSGETVIGKTGSSVPAAIARDTLVYLHTAGAANAGVFKEPEGFSKRRICALSGMDPTTFCPSDVTEYIALGEAPEPCDWHGEGSVVSYPAEYQSWFFASRREGELDYASAPLEILTPRNNFVFFTSPGAGLDGIPVEILGGKEDKLLAIYDGVQSIITRPFLFYLPSEPGLHTLIVKNGEEQAETIFRVE